MAKWRYRRIYEFLESYGHLTMLCTIRPYPGKTCRGGRRAEDIIFRSFWLDFSAKKKLKISQNVTVLLIHLGCDVKSQCEWDAKRCFINYSVMLPR